MNKKVNIAGVKIFASWSDVEILKEKVQDLSNNEDTFSSIVDAMRERIAKLEHKVDDMWNCTMKEEGITERIEALENRHCHSSSIGYTSPPVFDPAEPNQPEYYGYWECSECGHTFEHDSLSWAHDGRDTCWTSMGGCGKHAVKWIPTQPEAQEPRECVGHRADGSRIEPKAQEESRGTVEWQLCKNLNLENTKLLKENAELQAELKLYKDTYVPPGTTPYFDEPKAQELSHSKANEYLRKENTKLKDQLKRYEEMKGLIEKDMLDFGPSSEHWTPSILYRAKRYLAPLTKQEAPIWCEQHDIENCKECFPHEE